MLLIWEKKLICASLCLLDEILKFISLEWYFIIQLIMALSENGNHSTSGVFKDRKGSAPPYPNSNSLTSRQNASWFSLSKVWYSFSLDSFVSQFFFYWMLLILWPKSFCWFHLISCNKEKEIIWNIDPIQFFSYS